ncbi:hypothetical protein M427DRAFT_321632 [Gonapodya prolifera JEL478]|uniref:Uncharacterized protein n=1 Tax=Gonapodya prolifera (strain JEL478) TaxID=1344416 RepID=A0A139AG59_GONPJ|nr:hypothetical protein M427DRAFT_321632 [Gonapodya prolifera JEL478]|eukprot:KXS15777.1 hypothetical protein M427DRAFT_321632 [Gonapodya prolifera JEL478]
MMQLNRARCRHSNSHRGEGRPIAHTGESRGAVSPRDVFSNFGIRLLDEIERQLLQYISTLGSRHCLTPVEGSTIALATGGGFVCSFSRATWTMPPWRWQRGQRLWTFYALPHLSRMNTPVRLTTLQLVLRRKFYQQLVSSPRIRFRRGTSHHIPTEFWDILGFEIYHAIRAFFRWPTNND